MAREILGMETNLILAEEGGAAATFCSAFGRIFEKVEHNDGYWISQDGYFVSYEMICTCQTQISLVIDDFVTSSPRFQLVSIAKHKQPSQFVLPYS